MIRRAWGVERVGLKYQYVLPTRSEPVNSISLRFRGQDGMGEGGACGSVPASQRRLHGSLRVFHFRHSIVRGDEDVKDISVYLLRELLSQWRLTSYRGFFRRISGRGSLAVRAI